MLNGSSRKIDKIIKNEIKRYNEIFKNLFMFKKENNSNFDENKLNVVNKSLIKKKINVINLKSNFANKNKTSNNENNNNDSLDNITNNLKNKFNKIEIYNNNKCYKKGISRNSNNMSNESCNIHDSSASMSKIDSVNGIYLNIK